MQFASPGVVPVALGAATPRGFVLPPAVPRSVDVHSLLESAGDLNVKSCARVAWDVKERQRLDRLTKAEMLEDYLDFQRRERARKTAKTAADNVAASALRSGRHDEYGTPVIADPPERVSDEEKAHHTRMATLAEGFFQMRKDLGLAGQGGAATGCSWAQVKIDLKALASFLCGGVIAFEFMMAGIDKIKVDPIALIRKQVFNPAAFSDTALDVIGAAIPVPRHRGGTIGIIPSSTAVSTRRVKLANHLRPRYDVTIENMGWRYNHVLSLLVPFLRFFKAHEKIKPGDPPMSLKSWVDGAPTCTEMNRTALMLHFLDGRLHPGIAREPQAKDWHQMLAEYFGDESPASLCDNFLNLYCELRRLTETGVSYDGHHIAVDHFHCPDMKARFSGVKHMARLEGRDDDDEEAQPSGEDGDEEDYEEPSSEELGSLPCGTVGGGISNATWPDDLGPCHACNRTRGYGGGCQSCRNERGTPCMPGRLVTNEQDLHFWIDAPSEDGFSERRCAHSDPFDESGTRAAFIAERDARLTRMRAESTDGSDPLQRVIPLIANKAARVREVHWRNPSLKIKDLEKKNVDDLTAMLTALCRGVVLASDKHQPAAVVSRMNDAGVVTQLKLHNMTHDSRRAAECRALLQQRLVDLIVLRQVMFALEWPGIPRSCLFYGLVVIGDVLHLEVRRGEGGSRKATRQRRKRSMTCRALIVVTCSSRASVTSASRR